MNDITLALLGDRAAQERITERGELLPCSWCNDIKVEIYPVKESGYFYQRYRLDHHCAVLNEYVDISIIADSEEECKDIWNTRAPILTPEQIKRLEEME